MEKSSQDKTSLGSSHFSNVMCWLPIDRWRC